MSDAVVRVVAAVLEDAVGRVLIAQRPLGKHMAGYWEFPGGKIAAGEDARTALTRELEEELGVKLQRCRALLELAYRYPDRTVALEVFLVEQYQGEPRGLEGQALRWSAPHELSQQPLLPADGPIVEAIVARAQTRAAATEFDLPAASMR